MRKTLRKIIAVTALMCVSMTAFVGCGSSNSMEEDYEFNFSTIFNKDMASSENGYYFIQGQYLYYMDKKSDEPIVLCNKPDCFHEKEDDPMEVYKCNGFFDMSGVNYIGVSDNKIYLYVNSLYEEPDSYPQVIEVNLDGTNRKTVVEFGTDVEFGSMAIADTVIHKGEIYYSMMSLEEDDNSITIYKYDINNKKNLKIFTCDGSSYINYILPYDHEVFFHVDNYEEDSSGIKVYDIESNVVSNIDIDNDLTANEGEIVGICPPVRIKDRTYVSVLFEDDTNIKENMYEIKDNSIEELIRENIKGRVISDGEYIYELVPEIEYMNLKSIKIFDPSFNLIREVELDLKSEIIEVVAGDEEVMFMIFHNQERKAVIKVDKKALLEGRFEAIKIFDCSFEDVFKSVMVKLPQ